MTVFEMNNRIEEALHPTIDKYAMYLRKSRADLEAEKDGEGETLARHRKILTDLAVRKGLYVEKVYEEVVSGETIEARSEIQKLIKDCYAGKYKGIIVIDISRLSRGNQGDAQTILDCLKFSNKNNGVLVVTPSKTYDIANNHDDEEYMEFELFMSRREYKMIKRRLDRGRVHAVVEGNYMGAKRPYGYNIVKTRKSRYLEPHPDEAPIVKMIYNWAANDNIAPGTIAARLDAMGIPSYHKSGWNRSTIKNILSNTLYIGKVRWFHTVRVKTLNSDSGELESHVTRYTDQLIEYDGKHDALVDIETFNAVKTKHPSSRTRVQYALVNPLAGILFCNKCGRGMRFKTYTNKKCNPRYCHDQVKICNIKSVLAKDIMDAVIYALKKHIEDIEIKLNNKSDIDEGEIKKQITALQSEFKKCETRKSKLFDGWEDGNITDNEFVERKTIITHRMELIKTQIQEIEKTIPEKKEYKEKLSSLHIAFDMITDNGVDAKIKNEYLKNIIKRIDFDRENNIEFVLDVTFN